MTEKERMKALIRSGLHDPKNDYKLFIDFIFFLY